MMSPFLREAFINALFYEMAERLNRGLDFPEALAQGMEAIDRQIRGTDPGLAAIYMDAAVREILNIREYGGTLH